jgi:uncharacterized protein involved in high-affinity Fe2+ transport
MQSKRSPAARAAAGLVVVLLASGCGGSVKAAKCHGATMTMAGGEVMCAAAMAGGGSNGGSGATTQRTVGMNAGSTASETVPEVNGQKPVPIQTLASAVWQGMRIEAQTMTPIRFVVFNGGGEQMIHPPTHASFHLMIMLTDAHTGEPIPYSSSVWATITNSTGRTVFDSTQWPMISAYMGPHYGDDVPHLASGDYKLSVLISPPTSERTYEYRRVWLKAHTVRMQFRWDAGTSTATVVGGAGSSASSSDSMSGMSGMNKHTSGPVNGVRAAPSRSIATTYWQGMRIQTRIASPRPVYTDLGGIMKSEPGVIGSNVYMMVMLNDKHTDQPITYAPVFATIRDSAGSVVYSGSMQPTISAFEGPFYGNNVRLPGAGRYTLTLRIDPPHQARHLEYQHVWLKPHTVIEHFSWRPATGAGGA